ncbi:hypothetical protein BPAE_0128g00300 [Botrytis paeoniae]|uniref:Uncharacterized protein n=1 Tax=Botrytis paeoniae TaxID=278948 RepID=A0A4Z1FJK7_9HELO|nr:hypothetical protein BPAE_0128g00300 [Botrytis paeoniae]
MDTPSTPQSRSAAAAASASKPITPSQIPLPSTPTSISTPKPATKVPLPETPIPNPTSSIEKLKFAAKIPLPETLTLAVVTSERTMDDAFAIPPEISEVPEVSSSVATELTPYLPSKPTSSFLHRPTPTPEISPLKLAPAPVSSSQSQSQSRLSDSSTSLTSPSGLMVVEEMLLLIKNTRKDK